MARKKGKPNAIIWYIVAVLFSFIGGVVGYFVLRNRDKKLAENVLIVGVVTGIAFWVINYLI